MNRTMQNAVNGVMSIFVVALAFAGVAAGCSCEDKKPAAATETAGAGTVEATEKKIYFGVVKEPQDSVLRMSVGPKLEHIDPQRITATWEYPYGEALFQGLVERHKNDPTKAVPGLAERWDATDEGKTWTFHLRKGVPWVQVKSTGPSTTEVAKVGEVTSADVHYSWARCLHPDFPCDYRAMFTDIFFQGMPEYNEALAALTKATEQKNEKAKQEARKKVDDLYAKLTGESMETPDPYTFVVHLHTPSTLMPTQAGFIVFRAVYKPAVEAHKDAWVRPENIVTNGPYALADWDDGKLVLVRNPYAWWWRDDIGVQTGGFDSIIGYTPENCVGVQNDYEAGNVDLTMQNCRADAKVVDANRDAEDIFIFLESRLNYVTVNWKKPPFTDQRIRLALGYAMNRDRVTREVSKGFYNATGALVPPNFVSWYQSPDNAFTYDPERAKRLLAEAGYGLGQGPAFEFKHRLTAQEVALAQSLQRDWEGIGFKVTLIPNDSKVHSAALRKGDFVVAAAGWGADYPDPMTWMVLATSGSDFNYPKWEDPEFNRTVNTAFRTPNLTERAEFYRGAESRLLDAGVLLPVMTGNAIILKKPYVEGVVTNIFDDHPLRYIGFRRSTPPPTH